MCTDASTVIIQLQLISRSICSVLLPDLSRTYLAHHELESDIIVILLSAHVCVSLTMTTCAFADETISSRAAVYALCEPVHSQVC